MLCCDAMHGIYSRSHLRMHRELAWRFVLDYHHRQGHDWPQELPPQRLHQERLKKQMHRPPCRRDDLLSECRLRCRWLRLALAAALPLMDARLPALALLIHRGHLIYPQTSELCSLLLLCLMTPLQLRLANWATLPGHRATWCLRPVLCSTMTCVKRRCWYEAHELYASPLSVARRCPLIGDPDA